MYKVFFLFGYIVFFFSFNEALSLMQQPKGTLSLISCRGKLTTIYEIVPNYSN